MCQLCYIIVDGEDVQEPKVQWGNQHTRHNCANMKRTVEKIKKALRIVGLN